MSPLPRRWIALSVIVRIAAVYLVGDSLILSPEVLTPVTDIRRLDEGSFLSYAGVSPYSGQTFQHPPLVLLPYHCIKSILGSATASAVIIAAIILDILIALILRKLSIEHSDKFNRRHPGITSTFLSPNLVALLYLFNPLSIAVCAGRSLYLLTSFSIVMGLYFAQRQQRGMGTLFIAWASYMSIYPLVLIPSLCLLIHGNESGSRSKFWSSIFLSCIAIFAWIFLFLLLSSESVGGSWSFLKCSYLSVLLVDDLTPNIGVIWYLSQEMFTDFRVFFLFLFSYHIFVYPIPLAIRIPTEPMFQALFVVGIAGVFKPYPSFADISLFLALLSMHASRLKEMRNKVVLILVFVYAIALAPVLWRLWLVDGAGNSNGYYGVTLVYVGVNVFLLMEVLYSNLRMLVIESSKTKLMDSKKKE